MVLLLAIEANFSSTAARTYPLEPGQAAIGSVTTYSTREEDTFVDVARANDLGYTELVIANPGIDPWLPGAGRPLNIPSFFLLPAGPRHGIVVNLVKQRLFYFVPGGKTVETYPIGVGGEGHSTPVGTTRIVSKRAHPTWYPPPSIRAEDPSLPGAIPPGPNNPMGAFAFYLGWPLYTIHGTNKPAGIGRNSSHGCLRLYPEDIKALFREVPIGTEVRIAIEDTESAWIGGELYLAVFPTKEQSDAIDIGQRYDVKPPEALRDHILAALGGGTRQVDWSLVDAVAHARQGFPVKITAPVSDPAPPVDNAPIDFPY